jgi:hypothetical protein
LTFALLTGCMKGKWKNEKGSPRNQHRFETKWRWVCGMPGVTERLVVSSPSVRGVWAHRLLRQFSESACIEACGSDRASDHCQLRAGGGLVLRLREEWNDQGCGIASAAFASKKSARSWTRRKGASQLGIAPKLAARLYGSQQVKRFFRP